MFTALAFYTIIGQKWAAALRTYLGVNPATYALTVNNGLGGGSYPAGSKVTVSANPAPGGSQFGSWSPATQALTNPYYPVAVYTMPAAATTLTANNVASGSPTLPNGTYKIVSLLGGLSIGATGTASGSLVQQQNYTASNSQQWTLTNLGGNVVELSLTGGVALEVVGGSTASGANLDVAAYTGAASQKWKINTQSYLIDIVNVNSGLGINNGYSTQAGVQLNQSPAGFSSNQLWAFYPGGGGGSPPAAPTGLTAAAGNTQVTLNWTASSGATSYNVYRGTAAGGESATPVATGVTGTSYTNTGLANGTAYYFKVAAVNAYGTSGYSNEASATPAAGGGGSAVFANASFETPSTGNYTYDSTGTSWTFTNYAGIQHNGSAYSGSGPVAPDGVQTGFVQGVNGDEHRQLSLIHRALSPRMGC